MRLEFSIGWGFNNTREAEALLQEPLEEDSLQAAAAAIGGKEVQQLMAEAEWSWGEEEAALHKQSQL